MKIIQKRIVSLLVSVALLFTLLPMSAMAEDALPIQDSGQPLSLSIGVSNVSESSTELTFSASMDGTVYYAVYRADEQPPEEAVLLTKETVMAKEGSASAVVAELTAQTSYTAYALLEDTTGNRSAVAAKEFTTKGVAVLASEANLPAVVQVMGAGDIDINETNFPDASFRAWLHDQTYGSDNILTAEEIAAITFINVSDQNISDLMGIECFTALTELECSNNQLTALDVSNNTALMGLFCSDNQLTALDVSNNTALTKLSCDRNQLVALDVSKNTSLTTLDCSNNQLTALDVSKNTALLGLFCSDNQLTALDVSKNTSLTTLDCSNNQLTALDVSKNTALSWLSCKSNQLAALDVSKNTSLTTLSCSNNQLAVLDVSKNTSLTTIDCPNNQLAALDVSKNTSLTTIDCSNNQLAALDLSQNTNLESLVCSNNQLTALDLSKNTKLRYLNCSRNCMPNEAAITGLDKSLTTTFIFDPQNIGTNITNKFTDPIFLAEVRIVLGRGITDPIFDGDKFATVTKLRVAGKNIASLAGIEYFTSLTNLECYANQLTALDVSKNTNLEYLVCSGNQLGALDVSKNTVLNGLYCSDNQLTALDVSNNTKLFDLTCYANQLTTLDVSRNTALNGLYCSNNQLTALDVSKNTVLHTLNCSNNYMPNEAVITGLNKSLTTVFTFDPQNSGTPRPQIPASGKVSIKGVEINVNASDATTISYGGKEWRVIGANGEAGVATEEGSMTLLAKDNFGLTRFCEEPPYDTNNYSAIISKNTHESALKAAIESSVTFTTAEDAVIKLVNLTGGTNATAQDGMYGDDIKDAKLWPLSVSEANGVNSELRKATYYWWLRSPASRTDDAAIVIPDGNVDSIGGSPVGPSYDGGVRPALKLNLSSVLFTSAAAGGKSGSASANLSAAGAPTGAQKLTIVDSEHNLGTATTTNPLNAEQEITVNYTGASTGKALSAIVVKKADGAVTHYGKLAENISAASGTASVTLPDGFDSNTMDLKLFTETINDDNLTDYASQPVGVTVGAPAPTNVTLNAVTANGSATQTTTQLTLTFDKDISGLTAEDINIVGATKGTLTKETGTGVYTLGISDIKVSDNKYVKVSVSKAGYTFTPTARTATVRVYTPPISYTIQVSASPVSYGSITGGGSVTNGSSVTLKATANSGYRFVKWTENGTEVSTANPYTFTVNANRTLVAVFEANSSGSKGNGGNGNGGGTITMPSTNVTTEKQPNMPTVAKMSVSGTVKDGILSATITEQMVKDVIKAAQDAAKKSGKEADGIAVEFNVIGSGNYSNLTAALDAGTIDRLKEAGVKFVKIGSTVLDITLDTGAIAELDKQSTGAITVSAKKLTKLSAAAKALIGSRPVFDITVSYQKNGKTEYVSNFGKGVVTLGIAYKASGNENKGNLFGVYVDKNGKPQLLTNSSYDNTGRLIFSRNSLSTYGVGYKAPAPTFTDTAKHWAKDNIDFVVSRDLIRGTSTTTFAPTTAITRADFLMALGRLFGADVSSYKTGSFTDVKNTDPAMPYIEWAVKNKIVQGIGNGKFGPNQPISRQDIAVMMQNYAKATGYKLPVSRQSITFADEAKIPAYAKDAVKAIQQAGIMQGKSSNTFDPKGNATRGEASTILRRFVELVIDEGTARGWVQNDAGQWQYIGENGKPVIDWLTAEGGKYQYYFTTDGIMVAGKWLEIEGKWYYFNANGSLARSTKIGEYEVDENGVRKAK